MKRLITFLIAITLIVSLVPASLATVMAQPFVTPTKYSGNDSQQTGTITPSGYVYYKLDTGNSGNYSFSFNSTGQISSNGSINVNITISNSGNGYTWVNWSSNINLYSVIVKGSNSYNEYRYNNQYSADMKLISPTNSSGKPADVSHVSFVFNPVMLATGSINGLAWNDLNSDGIQNEGEVRFNNVTVNLLDANSSIVATKTTNSEGRYSFTNLTAGTYAVQFVLPNGYLFTLKTAESEGIASTVNSDAGTTNGKTGTITLVAGGTANNVDAGLKVSGNEISLKGVKYAYIFGHEPEFRNRGDGLGYDVILNMDMDGPVSIDQVSAMIIRLIEQEYELQGTSYPVTPVIKAYEGKWYERGLAYMASTGVFDNVDTVKIGNATRADVARLLTYALRLTERATTPYTDIANHPDHDSIEAMFAFGYMLGTTETTFAPDRVMTRGEFCTLMNRITGRDVLGLEALDENGIPFTITKETYYFTDMNDSTHWAYNECLKATSNYNKDGYIDLVLRQKKIRNILDQYNSQKQY